MKISNEIKRRRQPLLLFTDASSRTVRKNPRDGCDCLLKGHEGSDLIIERYRDVWLHRRPNRPPDRDPLSCTGFARLARSDCGHCIGHRLFPQQLFVINISFFQ